jgi:hypothetical protein
VKQVIESICAHTLGECTPGLVARFHSEGLPPARILAPISEESRLTAANASLAVREDLKSCAFSTIIWLLDGLEQQHIKGKAVTQQALELLCAMSDLLVASLTAAAPGQTSSSSRTQKGSKDTAMGWMLQHTPPGEARQHTC